MEFKIILASRAIQDLQGIVRYISFDNPDRAESFGRALISEARRLAAFLEMSRGVSESNEPHVRVIIPKSHRIVYRIKPQERRMEVSRFWDGACGTPCF